MECLLTRKTLWRVAFANYVTSTRISHGSERGGGVRLNVLSRTPGVSTGFTVSPQRVMKASISMV